MAKSFLEQVLRWAVLSFLLTLAWEAAQLPLYAIWQTDGVPPCLRRSTLHSRGCAHCVSEFPLHQYHLRHPGWVSSMPWRGSVLVIPFRLIYTTNSEWHNVYEIGVGLFANHASDIQSRAVALTVVATDPARYVARTARPYRPVAAVAYQDLLGSGVDEDSTRTYFQ